MNNTKHDYDNNVDELESAAVLIIVAFSGLLAFLCTVVWIIARIV